jgi:hypothetical protein
MRFKMQDSGEILAGALEGKKVFSKMVAATTTSGQPQVCFLDFSNVTVATTSFLRESVIAYRNHARTHWNTVYPVVANLGNSVLEELDYFLRDQGDALVICKLKSGERPSDIQVLGRLDEKQEITLRAVIQEKDVDASTLAKRYNKEKVSTTAWNNRLAGLVAKGLVIESSSGRGKRYRPVLERLRYGT